MQVFREGTFYGQWGVIDNFGSPAPALSAMKMAKLINERRCEGPARNPRGLAKAIAAGTWSTCALNYHRPNQPAVTIVTAKVPGGYVLKLA